MEISIIIQGLLNNVSLSNIDNYNKFGKVLLGVYTTETFDLSFKCRKNGLFVPPNASIVDIKFPPPPGANLCNIYYQSWSTYHLLERVDTEFVIKVRSDEKFTDLSPIIKKLEQYPDKFITNNVGFVSCKHVAYHPSDHLIACKTQRLKQTFNNIIEVCQSIPNYNSYLNLSMFVLDNNQQYMNEQIIFISSLIAKYGINKTNDLLKINPSDLMKQETDVVPFDELGDIISSNLNGGCREYRNSKEMQCIYDNGPGCIPCIRSIEEV